MEENSDTGPFWKSISRGERGDGGQRASLMSLLTTEILLLFSLLSRDKILTLFGQFA